jgi:hypothetical protein
MDFGLFSEALAEGIKSGTASYNDARKVNIEKKRQEQDVARQNEMLQLEKYKASRGLVDSRNQGLLDASKLGKVASFDESGIMSLADDPEYQRRKAEADALENRYKRSQIAKNEADVSKARRETKGQRLPPDKVLTVQAGGQIPTLLEDIKKSLAASSQDIGPVAGLVGKLNPYNEKSKTLDAQLRTAAQTYGRYMEGGVLRKEDEEKYRRMFPQVTDTPEVAANKLLLVERSLKDKQAGDLAALSDSGYDISGFKEVGEIPQLPEVLTRSSVAGGIIPAAQAKSRDSIPLGTIREKDGAKYKKVRGGWELAE